MKSSVRRWRATTPSFVALALITGTTALSTDTYIAALPQVESSLHTPSSVAQLTMTACILGMAIGQLVTGSISDARGRRNLIMLATITFSVTSVVCALAVGGWELVIVRAVQGFSCGAAAAVGRAVVTDTWTGREMAARFGTLSAIGLIAPVVGPAIGGVLLAFGDWRSVFWFLAIVGVVMTVAAFVGVPETLPAGSRQPGGLRQLVSRAADLAHDRSFIVPVLTQCLTTAGFFIYIGGSSFVLQQGLGISEDMYTVVFAVNACAMMLSSLTFRLLVVRFGAAVLRRCAMVVQTAAVTGLFVVALVFLTGRPPLAAVWICLAGITLGLGTFQPANGSIAQAAGRRYAGTASAMSGGLPFLIGSLTTPLTGLVGSQTVPTMAIPMFTFFALSAGLALLAARRRSRGPAPLTTGPVVIEQT
jgi:DHA1 family bicyclomycin/chloramphenicol resistance-like MFS transporter